MALTYEEVEALPFGAQRTAAAQILVDEADLAGDRPAACRAREALVRSAEYSGRQDLALPAVAWMLRVHDEGAAVADLHTLLWQYKWVITALPGLPTVPRPVIDAALEDFAARTRRYGAGAHATAQLRWWVDFSCGDLEAARAGVQVWRGLRRDSLSDCIACDASGLGKLLADAGDDDDALEELLPVIGGIKRCMEEPARALAYALAPLRRTGRLDEAHRYHLRGYRYAAVSENLLVPVALHVEHLALTGKLSRAIALAERHRAAAQRSPLPGTRLRFMEAALTLLEVARARGLAQLPLLTPIEAVVQAQGELGGLDDDDFGVDRQLDLAVASAEHLAAAFDRRNGNTTASNRLGRARQAAETALNAPLATVTPTAAGAAAPAAPPPPEARGAPAASMAAAASGTDDEEQLRAGDALRRSGDLPAARAVFAELLTRTDPADTVRVLHLRRRLLHVQLGLPGTDPAAVGADLVALHREAELAGEPVEAARCRLHLSGALLQANEVASATEELAAAVTVLADQHLDAEGRQARAFARARLARLRLAADRADAEALLEMARADVADDAVEGAWLALEWAYGLASVGELRPALARAEAVGDLDVTDGPSRYALHQLAVLRARLLSALEQYVDAGAAWEQAHRLGGPTVRHPDEPIPLVQAAEVYLRGQAPARAIAAASSACQVLDPQHEASAWSAALQVLARAQFVAGQPEVAIDALLDGAAQASAWAEPAPDHAGDLRYLAARMLGDTDDASLAVEEALRAAEHYRQAGLPRGAAASLDLASRLAPAAGRRRELSDAAAAALLAVDLPLAASACLRREADALGDLGDHQAGLQVLARARTLLPDTEDGAKEALRVGMAEGWLQLNAGRASEAAALALRAVDGATDDQLPDALWLQARCHSALGDSEEAIGTLQRLLHVLSPDDERAREHVLREIDNLRHSG